MLFVALASLAFAWLLWPLSDAILWAIILAMVFLPLQRYLTARFQRRPDLAAFVTMPVIVFIVVLPMGLVGAAPLREISGLYDLLQAGKLDFGHVFHKVAAALPDGVRNLMSRFDVETLSAAQEKLADGLHQGGRFLATRILDISQSTVQLFVNLGVLLLMDQVYV